MFYLISALIFTSLLYLCTRSNNETFNLIAFGVVWASGAIYFHDIINWHLLIIACIITIIYNFILGYSSKSDW